VTGRWWLVLALTGAALSPGGPAIAASACSRVRSAAIADTRDVETRRLGVLALGERGLMTDMPQLSQALRDVDPLVRAFAENTMWRVWSRSGDDAVDQLFAVGVEQMGARLGEAAVETFTEVIRRRPEFAEGWNKRATVYYLVGEYEKSLADCDEVMKRNPYHFGALSGYGMIYLKLDRPAKALDYLQQALRVNPNLESVQQTVEMLKSMLIQRRKDTI